jgi:hypothetical protein
MECLLGTYLIKIGVILRERRMENGRQKAVSRGNQDNRSSRYVLIILIYGQLLLYVEYDLDLIL